MPKRPRPPPYPLPHVMQKAGGQAASSSSTRIHRGSSSSSSNNKQEGPAREGKTKKEDGEQEGRAGKEIHTWVNYGCRIHCLTEFVSPPVKDIIRVSGASWQQCHNARKRKRLVCGWHQKELLKMFGEEDYWEIQEQWVHERLEDSGSEKH